MTDQALSDELWARLAPLLPVHTRRFRFPGRRRADDRAVVEGILFMLASGIGFNQLPTAAFGVSRATCWRRLDEWTRAGRGSDCTRRC
ncbi:hypothetical protein Val02_78370 [Virgisporangium aliadipatigenens]|uniref:Insertion element IS402-like domain-containing protein n=1 Tax=Virgisporangium aliadipatigenens TaxID=741659 RepID=A0A8J4DV03_9ACTN|nr:transposase [Virgisporangium aliadipatigenens]GIJ50951.1 hypothetical protein Val02_78370 [Virgisporangium aliadipatigenens]